MIATSVAQLAAIASFFAGHPVAVGVGPGNNADIQGGSFTLQAPLMRLLNRATPANYARLLNNVAYQNAVFTFGHELGHLVRGYGRDHVANGQGGFNDGIPGVNGYDLNDPRTATMTEGMAQRWSINHLQAIYQHMGFPPPHAHALAVRTIRQERLTPQDNG